NKAEGHPKGWPFCVGAEKPAGCGFALSGLQKNNPTEWHGSAAGQLRAIGQYRAHNPTPKYSATANPNLLPC
ncbi:hypothetical protein ACMZZG_10630, partial [Pseudocitrobacter faecalis]|uniref:hypothetical protein n=1 Tax=Pseudocitrobacter faecalis TaxID=1398493 RepID=UPI0039F0E6E7